MNERIRELAEYAWEYTTEQNDGWINESGEVNWDFLHAYDKKFAELIVKECEVALKPPVQVRNVISRGQAYDLIKKHFGVEE